MDNESELTDYFFLKDGTLAPKGYTSSWLGWKKRICDSCKKPFMAYRPLVDNTVDSLCPICFVDADESDLDKIREEIEHI